MKSLIETQPLLGDAIGPPDVHLNVDGNAQVWVLPPVPTVVLWVVPPLAAPPDDVPPLAAPPLGWELCALAPPMDWVPELFFAPPLLFGIEPLLPPLEPLLLTDEVPPDGALLVFASLPPDEGLSSVFAALPPLVLVVFRVADVPPVLVLPVLVGSGVVVPGDEEPLPGLFSDGELHPMTKALTEMANAALISSFTVTSGCTVRLAGPDR